MSAVSSTGLQQPYGPAWEPEWVRAWMQLAEQVYGFDHVTALRLVFVSWLVASGRLSDW
ncbi:MAG TPA: hypothetical protein VFE37_05720 [Chloroflexota bacterium]|nr:hypothetical protein [Chloroflexota bacterium]